MIARTMVGKVLKVMISKKLPIVIMLLSIIIFLIAPGAYAGESSEGFTRHCKFDSDRTTGLNKLTDGSYQGVWTAKDDYSYIEIYCPELPGGIMVAWADRPDYWFLLGSCDGMVWKAIKYVGDDFKHQYISLENCNYNYLRVMMPRVYDAPYSISEIKLHAKGGVPEDIQIWQPTVEDARLMVISAHADDESVFFSGVLPTYTVERSEDTVVVYMAANENYRASEALSALWAAGVRTYPVFAPFPDEYSETIDAAQRYWGGYDTVTGYLVELFRKYKPEVVLTHDLDGEYGHGAHMLTAAAALDAAGLAADAENYTESAFVYGVWDTPKLYLHLYKENQIDLDFNIPLSSFGGMTAWQVVEQALQQHKSQLHWQIVRVHNSGKYLASLYGLARTTVGYDNLGNDLFENIQ